MSAVCWSCGNGPTPQAGLHWDEANRIAHLRKPCAECAFTGDPDDPDGEQACSMAPEVAALKDGAWEDWYEEHTAGAHAACHGDDCPAIAAGLAKCDRCGHAVALRGMALAEEHHDLESHLTGYDAVVARRNRWRLRGTRSGSRTERFADTGSDGLVEVLPGTKHAVIEARLGVPYRVCRPCADLLREEYTLDPDYHPSPRATAEPEDSDDAGDDRLTALAPGAWLTADELAAAWGTSNRTARRLTAGYVLAGQMEVEERPTPGGGKPMKMWRSLAEGDVGDDDEVPDDE